MYKMFVGCATKGFFNNEKVILVILIRWYNQWQHTACDTSFILLAPFPLPLPPPPPSSLSLSISLFSSLSHTHSFSLSMTRLVFSPKSLVQRKKWRGLCRILCHTESFSFRYNMFKPKRVYMQGKNVLFPQMDQQWSIFQVSQSTHCFHGIETIHITMHSLTLIVFLL